VECDIDVCLLEPTGFDQIYTRILCDVLGNRTEQKQPEAFVCGFIIRHVCPWVVVSPTDPSSVVRPKGQALLDARKVALTGKARYSSPKRTDTCGSGYPGAIVTPSMGDMLMEGA
jgi:hypothetical protein